MKIDYINVKGNKAFVAPRVVYFKHEVGEVWTELGYLCAIKDIISIEVL